MQPPEITLAMPAYNEEGNIREVVQESIAHLNRQGRSWEIIVIDNHSSDNTAEEVRKLMKTEPRVRLVVHETNRFYAGSCQTAVNECRGKYLAIMDSDRQFTADDLPKFIAKLENGANLVFGWRRVRHDPLFRKLISTVFNTMGKVYLGVHVHDLNVGIRMMDRKCIAAARYTYKGNFSNPELFVRAKKAGLKIDDVEIQHFERTAGAACHNFRKMAKLFFNVNSYLLDMRRELHSRATPPAAPADGISTKKAA